MLLLCYSAIAEAKGISGGRVGRRGGVAGREKAYKDHKVSFYF